MHVPYGHLTREATQNILKHSEQLKAKLQELRTARQSQQKPVTPSKPANS